MAYGKVCWDVDVLRNSLHTLNVEKQNLMAQISQMKAEHNKIDINWKSPAGQRYQNRLQNDKAMIDDIINKLENRTASLHKVIECYSQCEAQVKSALKRLPC